MTQLDDSHDLLHAENKDRIYQHNKIIDKLEKRIATLEKVLEKYEYGAWFQPKQLKVTTFEFRKDFLLPPAPHEITT